MMLTPAASEFLPAFKGRWEWQETRGLGAGKGWWLAPSQQPGEWGGVSPPPGRRGRGGGYSTPSLAKIRGGGALPPPSS